MVSHSDRYTASGLLAAPPLSASGAASVVGAPPPSSATHPPSSRARRYNRSHAGGSSYVPLNEFPVFANSGDVEIVVRARSGHENRYLLHRDTLARCSGFFEISTSREWSRAQVVGGRATGNGNGGGGGGDDGTNGDSDTKVRQLEPAEPSGAALRALTAGDELARIPDETKTKTAASVGAERTGSSFAGNWGFGAVPPAREPRRRWRYELDWGDGENDKPILVQKEETGPANGSFGSFGGGIGSIGSLGSLGFKSSAALPPPTHSQAAATHSNSGFFRSVANLALSSSHHGHHSSHQPSSSSRAAHSSTHRRHGSTAPPGILSPPSLPPPSPEDVDLLRDYDNLFRIMYNYAPLLDGVNIADAYVQCKSLLAVADEYDALAVVGPRVDHHLLQFQSRLWRQIAKYPISYLRLGYLARSRIIFQEALVHVVGQWPVGERSLRAAMPDAVLDLIEDKVDELAEAVARVEARLFRLHLTTRTGERVTPATAYLDWLAMSLFRQWLADNTTPVLPPPAVGGVSERGGGGDSAYRGDGRHSGGDHHHHHHRGASGAPRSSRHGRASSSSSASSGGQNGRGGGGGGRHGYSGGGGGGGPGVSAAAAADAATSGDSRAMALHVRTAVVPPMLTPPLSTLGRAYRTLGTSVGQAFLGHDECKRFLKLTPELYSRDNLKRFEKRIDELKAMAREIVRPLMGSALELDVSGSGGGGGNSGNDGRDGRGGRHGGGSDYVTYFTCTYVCDRDLPWMAE